MADASDSASESESEAQARYDAAREALGLPRLSVAPAELRSATDDRWPFDVFGWELIGRTGQVCEMLVEATGRLRDGSKRGLSLNEAVNGGLVVRLTKLLRALFDATQADESEAHQILARCTAETAVNLRWLLLSRDAEAYKRFRAAGYRTFLRILEKVDADHADPVVKGTGERVVDIVTRELLAAGVERDDVPNRSGRWGGDLRQRFEELGETGLYDVFFGTHSDFVHGSWHELRTFHLRMTPRGYELDLTYGGLTPSAMYETSRLVFRAIRDYTSRMPLAGIDLEALRTIADGTIEAAKFATLEFARFIAEGGIDDDTNRLLQTQTEAAALAVRERVEYQAERTGGGAVEMRRYKQDTPAWAEALVQQFVEAPVRACPHLHEDPTQPSIWLAALPDLLACQGLECERRLIPTLEDRLGHSLKDEPAHCSVCGREALVQGVSVGVGSTMIRGMICEDCKSGAQPSPEPQ